MQGKKCAGKTDSGSESNFSGLWTFLVCRPDRQGTDSTDDKILDVMKDVGIEQEDVHECLV